MSSTGALDHKPTLMVIIGSVREGRVGKAVADWFTQVAREHGAFNVTVADLKELDLPLMTEPNHPRMKRYTQPKTKRWSAMVDAADAFVIVTPEHNFSATAPVINALDYLYQEWHAKPCGLVSYGGLSGGLRAQQHLKQKITTLKMMPMYESVAIPFVSQQLNDETGAFEPSSGSIASATTAMIDALVQWQQAMRTMRAPVSAD